MYQVYTYNCVYIYIYIYIHPTKPMNGFCAEYFRFAMRVGWCLNWTVTKTLCWSLLRHRLHTLQPCCHLERTHCWIWFLLTGLKNINIHIYSIYIYIYTYIIHLPGTPMIFILEFLTHIRRINQPKEWLMSPIDHLTIILLGKKTSQTSFSTTRSDSCCAWKTVATCFLSIEKAFGKQLGVFQVSSLSWFD